MTFPTNTACSQAPMCAGRGGTRLDGIHTPMADGYYWNLQGKSILGAWNKNKKLCFLCLLIILVGGGGTIFLPIQKLQLTIILVYYWKRKQFSWLHTSGVNKEANLQGHTKDKLASSQEKKIWGKKRVMGQTTQTVKKAVHSTPLFSVFLPWCPPHHPEQLRQNFD